MFTLVVSTVSAELDFVHCGVFVVTVAKMMESCLAGKPERTGPVEVEDIRRDLLGEFSSLPAQVSLPVCLPTSLCVPSRDARPVSLPSG